MENIVSELVKIHNGNFKNKVGDKYFSEMMLSEQYEIYCLFNYMKENIFVEKLKKEDKNKIFEKIILVIRINISNLSNISDLISFSKSLNRKLSSQLLCEILEKNKNNYFVLCAIAYYIKDNDDINKLYKIVLRKLYQQILDFIQNFPTTITPNNRSNKLRDSNYFYILNDFSFYTGFTKEQKEKIRTLKQSALEDMQDRNNAEHSIYKKLMEKSYFNWELNSMDFEKLLIKKILTNNSRNINY